jgi:hypothetical protein
VPPITVSGVSFHHITRVFPPKTGGVIPGDAVAGPADFATWLTTHPYLRATNPKPVEALGLKGVSIDVRVKSSQPRAEPASAFAKAKPPLEAVVRSARVAR